MTDRPGLQWCGMLVHTRGYTHEPPSPEIVGELVDLGLVVEFPDGIALTAAGWELAATIKPWIDPDACPYPWMLPALPGDLLFTTRGFDWDQLARPNAAFLPE